VTARRGARLWLFDLECFDEETCTVEPIDHCGWRNDRRGKAGWPRPEIH
jgi:hypothetical protein